MVDTAVILGGVMILVGMLGYSRLMPTPSTPRHHWLPRSLSASGAAAVCALVAAMMWQGSGQYDRYGVWSRLTSVGPYILGGWVMLAAGTYLKVRLWHLKNKALDPWRSRHG